MANLPIFNGDLCTSIFGIMLFPEDKNKAQAWASAALSKGALQNYLKKGGSFARDELIDYSVAFGRALDINPAEIKLSWERGIHTGVLVKIFYCMINKNPKSTWNMAKKYARAHGYLRNEKGAQLSDATIKNYRAATRRVQHMWGAFAIRDWNTRTDVAAGYDGLISLAAFMAEAESLQICLEHWSSQRVSLPPRHNLNVSIDFYRWPDNVPLPKIPAGYPPLGALPDIVLLGLR